MIDSAAQTDAKNPAFKRTHVDKNGLTYTICPVEEKYFDSVLKMYDLYEPKESAQGLPPKDPVRRKKLILNILNDLVNVIALQNDNVVGHCALLDIQAGVFAELLIVVHQDWQGLGIGNEMTELLIDIARYKKYKKIWLTVEASNMRAIHIYKKFGFIFKEGMDLEREMELLLDNDENCSDVKERLVRNTGIVRDTFFFEHKTGVHHPESPQRLETIYTMIDRNNLINKLSPIPARLASLEEVELCHSQDYIDRVMDTAGEELRYLDPDTVTSENSCKAAFLAAGSCMEAVKRVVLSDIDNAFALIRPPGHHAERNRQMGFCIFNNPALAAAYALRFLGMTRILIIDWDVHHCNGTQHIFESTDEVLVFSTHRSPFFPGTGTLDEKGEGKGLGYSINVPLTPLKSDRDFIEIYREILFPVALEYKPQLILISAGFDTHYDDPIGGMKVTENGFAYLTSIILEMADRVCDGKVVAILEGGYDLGALRKSVHTVLETLCGEVKEEVMKEIDTTEPDPSTVKIIQEVKDNYKKFWRSLNNA